MKSTAKTTFYVLQKGSVQEEPWEWADIVEMCESGSFTPDTMVFFPDQNEWKRAGETELAGLFPQEAEDRSDGPDAAQVAASYQDALAQIDTDPDDWSGYVEAASIAMSMGERDKALSHLQAFLDVHPYHPRFTQEAKRELPPQLWRKLRRLERAEPAWDDMGALAAYPLARGALFLAIPAVILGAISLVPLLNLLAGPVLFLAAVQAVYASARGDRLPPGWTLLLGRPIKLIVQPLVVGAVVSCELALPFVLVGLGLRAAGLAGDDTLAVALASSPIMVVLASTVSVLYLPAVLMMVGSGSRSWSAIDPRQVARMIVKLEREYFVAVALVVAALAVWAGSTFVFGFVPVLGQIWSASFLIYGVLWAGRILGMLCRRHQDELFPSDPAAP